MNIFYGKSAGRTNVSCDSPAEASLEIALAVFQGLGPKSGFMGIILDDQFTLQLLIHKPGKIRVELLDTSIPALDSSIVEAPFAESLIPQPPTARMYFRSHGLQPISGIT